ncbi:MULTISPECIES: polymorphic toxin-type HINT domain-containing protein [Bacillales]|uniref:polymorphic toxin-type HINT domain-containing protein n=1 Tax=Bacillales TaxID=1385 RepID=UPI00035CC07B|nr:MULTISPECIES: polymorphic toxin-type HINT domain-containing protein [Bacillales]
MKLLSTKSTLIFILCLSLLTTLIPPVSTLANESSNRDVSNTQSIESSTPNETINEIQQSIAEQNLNPLPEKREAKNPASYNAEDIASLTWTQLDANTAIEIHQTFDRSLLKYAAYFYSDLLQLLSTEEQAEVKTFSSDQLISQFDNLSQENKALLNRLTPLVASKVNELKSLEETLDIQAVNTTPPEVLYTEKDQEFRFARSKTEQAVDDVYRSANLVEQDLYLPGKHGLDLDIKRRYHSMSSKISAPSWDDDLDKNEALKDNEKFATGWDFNMPRLDIVTREQAATVRDDPYNPGQQIYSTKVDKSPTANRYYISLEDGTSLEYRFNKFVNYPYKDIMFITDDVNRKYTLHYRNLKYEFDVKLGTVVKSNIYGDTIKYNLNSDGEPVSIEDSVGRYVVLKRKQNDTTQDLIVYKDKTETTVLKHIRYHFERKLALNGYFQLVRVEVLPTAGSGSGSYTVANYSYHNPTTKGIAYFNLNKEYTLDKLPTDQSLQDSAKYWESDTKKRKEIDYLLMQEVSYPLQGLKINYEYRPYQLGQTTFNDGLVRIFQDKYALSYVAYHPVNKVSYSYTQKTPKGTNTYKLEKSYANNDNLREIWKVPKEQLPRLKNFAERHGDTIQVTESEASRYTKNSIYKVNQDGNTLLRSEKTTGVSKGGTNVSGAKYRVEYNPTTYTTYAYSGRNTKPTYQYVFLEPTSAVSDLEVYNSYLKDPNLSNRSRYAAKINNYAQETYLEYNDYGQLIKQIAPDGIVSTWTYDAEGVNPWGFRTFSVLKAARTQSTSASGDPYYSNTTFEYNNQYLLRKETEINSFPANLINNHKSQSIERTYEYTNNQLYSITENFGAGKTRTQTFTAYDQYGVQPTQIALAGVELESGKSDVLNFSYDIDDKGQIKSQTYPNGSKATYEYDELGRPLSETFQNQGAKRTITYVYRDGEASGSSSEGPGIVEKIAPDQSKLITYYTPYGDTAYQEQVGTTGAKRPLVENEFTPDGLEISRTVPYGKQEQSTSYLYDWDGFVYQTTNSLGTTKNHRNNAYSDGTRYLPRLTEQTLSPNGYIATTYRDLYGKVESTEETTQSGSHRRVTNYQTDRFGKVTNKEISDGKTSQAWSMRFDHNDNLVYLQDPENNVNVYGYDGLGNLTSVLENGTTTAEYTYNSLAWKLSEKNPETKAETYTYDKSGLVKSYKDKNGVTFNYDYTPFNELKKVSSGASFYEDRVYDPQSGLLLSENNHTGNAISYGYDGFHRKNRQTMMGKDYQLLYSDNDDTIDTLVYPARGAVSGSAPSLSVGYTYDNANRLNSVAIPGVGTTTYTYDISNSGETNAVSYPGQLKAMQQSVSSFGEKTALNHADGWNETNGYDLFGNITSQKRSGTNYGLFVYDKLSRIKEESVEGNVKQYAYDKRGNRQVYANAPANILGSYEMKHDLFNRLQEYKDEKGTTTYTYYPGGLRATKQQTGNVTDTTHYVYLNGQVIEELTQDGRVKARNVFGNQLIWRKDYASNLEGTYYYNSHGDVVKIKAPNGNVLNTYDYDIWGNLIADKVKETISNPFMYAGEMFDKESGFYYLRARYYDPKIGRFISEDTYKGQVDNPLSLNRYTYVSNNPLKYVDPTGNVQEIHADWAPGKKKIDPLVNGLLLGYPEQVQKVMDTEPFTLENLAANAELFISIIPAVKIEGEVSQLTANGLNKAVKSTTIKSLVDCNCFTAGTKVLTDKGENNIEDIEVGDRVFSKDEETGEVAYKEVTATFNHETDEIYQIHVGDQIIESTYNHPFWVDGKGWTYVKDLKVGDLLVQSDGNTLEIDSIELLHKQVTVYNMTVDEFHTYFVSDLGIWVHNTNCFEGFRDFRRHWDDHKAEFGNISQEAYYSQAFNLATTKVDSVDVFSRTLSNGRTAIYKKSTNELVIVHGGADVGTYFKPKHGSTNPDAGWNYFRNTLR